MTSKKTILLTYARYTTFVQKDHQALNKQYHVIPYIFTAHKGNAKLFIEIFRQLWFILRHYRTLDVYYCWFSDLHAFIPALAAHWLKKQCIIIVGGYDAVSIPPLKYGLFYRHNIRSVLASKTYQWATDILCVDESLIESVNHYADPTGRGFSIGVKHFVTPLNAVPRCIPTGYDPKQWKSSCEFSKRQGVVTTAGLNTQRAYLLKGIDLLLETARLLPDIPFTIIGLRDEILHQTRALAPANVTITDYIENNQLPQILSKHKVYAQFSLTEGLPNALCEAMLCECIPVGSAVNGIPKAIGDTGFILHQHQAEQAASVIEQALKAPEIIGKKARERIIKLFSDTQRTQNLCEIIDHYD